MTGLVCLGDSFTEGMGDDTRADGNYRGWADRMAHGLAAAGLVRFPGPVRYSNLAIRGKLLRQVIDEQVPAALGMRPELVTFHAGPNDLLRPGADCPRVHDQYEQTVLRLRDAGLTVVLFTAITRSGGKGLVADRVAGKLEAFNVAVRSIAERYGCLLVDTAAVRSLNDRRFWASDRLHLTPPGHRRVAAQVLHVLGVAEPAILGGDPGWWERPLRPAPGQSRMAALACDAHWVGVHLIPWVGRRLRGVSTGDGRQPKDPTLRAVPVSPGSRV